MDKSKRTIVNANPSEIQLAIDMDELVEALYLNLGLQQMVNRAREILGHPMVIHDMGFKVLAASYDAHKVVNFIQDEHENKYINEDTIRFIRTNNVADKVRSKGFSEYIDKAEPLNGTFLSIIRINNIEIGQFAVYEAGIKFEDSDFRFIDKVTRLLSVEFQKNNAFNMHHNLILNYVLTDLLDGKTMPEDLVRDKLQDLNWIREKDLYIMVISDRDQQRLDIKIPAVIQALKEFIPLENCTVFQSNITTFIPGSLYDDLHTVSQSEFIKFLQVNSLRAGSSMRFSELSACKRYYSQAEKALEIGKKQNITLAAFKDSTLDIVSELITREYNFMDFCHPAVLKLWEFDQQNHVNLLPSLNSYLNFMSSPNDAAKELCIHRNTLFYRINKIKDITGIDLKHVSEISHLYFSIRLLKINGYEINY